VDSSERSCPVKTYVIPYICPNWTAPRDPAFELFKTNLPTAPILAMPSDTGNFTLDVDASNWAADAILQQEQNGLLRVRVIGYASKNFSASKQQ